MTKEETLKVLGFTKANIYQFWIDYFQGTNVDGKKFERMKELDSRLHKRDMTFFYTDFVVEKVIKNGNN